MASSIDWNEVSKKEARGSNNIDLQIKPRIVGAFSMPV